jgi:hypothetical protein
VVVSVLNGLHEDLEQLVPGVDALWERSDDGITWRPWMDIHFTRADDTSDGWHEMTTLCRT